MSIEAAQAAGKKLELEVRQHGQITTKSAMDPARIGKTLVESQSITAGTHVEKGTVVHVTLARMIAPKQSKVIVPALENMSLEAAQAVARKLELEVRQQGPITTKSAMNPARLGKTLVETQSIAAGTSVEKGTVIPVTLARFVASKQSKVSVPALENMSFEAAQSAAKKLELEVRPQGPIATKSSADPSRVGKTLVETQSVAAGTLVEKGAVLHVTLARFTAAKDAKVQVPALVGLPEGKVRELLKNAGLVLEVKGDSRRGLASNQWPAAGAMVAKGSTVSVAFAAPDSKVRVPDLRGLTEGEARSALEKTGLRIGAVNTREETSSDAKKSGPPRVTTQSVEPGAMAPRGAAIDVQLLRYIPRKSPHQRGDR
jgi:beta-lactam-binding protein with PASTA domain